MQATTEIQHGNVYNTVHVVDDFYAVDATSEVFETREAYDLGPDFDPSNIEVVETYQADRQINSVEDLLVALRTLK